MKRATPQPVEETSDLVRVGLADAARVSRDQIAGLCAFAGGRPKPVTMAKALNVDQTNLLLTHVKILATLSKEEREQIAANVGKFAGITDPAELAEYVKSARRFLSERSRDKLK